MTKLAVNEVYKLALRSITIPRLLESRLSTEYPLRPAGTTRNKLRSLSLVDRLRTEIMERASALIWLRLGASFLPSFSP
jgi:hypothetical protein